MSHFLLGVILPEKVERKAVRAYVEKVLEPYDENMEVAPYARPCGCGEWRAQQRADAIAAEETGLTWDALRETFRLKPEEERTQEAWTEHVASLREAEKRALARMEQKPDPDCSECHGRGTYTSTYNPNRKWDWWQIGGRWDGVLRGKEPLYINGFTLADFHERVGHNLVKMAELTRECMPFAFVLPDGTWLQQGEMRWWGIVQREDVSPEMWETKTLDALKARYGGLRVVAVDCRL